MSSAITGALATTHTRVGRNGALGRQDRGTPDRTKRQTPFQGPRISHAGGSSVQFELVGVQTQHVVRREKKGLDHLASFRNVSPCLLRTRFCARANAVRRPPDVRTGVMIRRSPSVDSSSSVSGVILRSSKMGLSMMIPALLPIARIRLVTNQ